MLISFISYFFIYSFIGWICECIYCGVPAKKFINRGFLIGPYCPIYGVGALLLITLLHPFLNKPLLLFLAAVIITSVLEYITSYFLEIFFHTKWWDYSKHHFQLHGRICLKNSLMFGGLGLILIYGLDPMINKLIQWIPAPQLSIMLFIAMSGFIFDFIHTLRTMLYNNQHFKEIQAAFQAKAELHKAELAQRLEEINHKQQLWLNKHQYITHHLNQAFPNRIEFKNNLKLKIEDFIKNNIK